MKKQAEISKGAEGATGWRGSRELWLRAAKEAFLESGLEAVKIMPLAARLEISRASFYWFFKDRQALLDALLEEWQIKNTGAFTTACTAYAETISEAVLNLFTAFNDETRFEPKLDFAVRGWAHQSDEVMKRVNTEDEIRLAAIRDMFIRFGFDRETADVRARMAYLVQIGYISMQVDEGRDIRMLRIPAYVQAYCGQLPSKSELARFHARLGYTPPEDRA